MKKQKSTARIDWMITLVPLALILALCVLFFFLPEQSNAVLSQIRFFFGDTFGLYYLIIGLGIFGLSLFLAFSKYGKIVLGEPNEKPKYSFFAWGAMMWLLTPTGKSGVNAACSSGYWKPTSSMSSARSPRQKAENRPHSTVFSTVRDSFSMAVHTKLSS